MGLNAAIATRAAADGRLFYVEEHYDEDPHPPENDGGWPIWRLDDMRQVYGTTQPAAHLSQIEMMLRHYLGEHSSYEDVATEMTVWMQGQGWAPVVRVFGPTGYREPDGHIVIGTQPIADWFGIKGDWLVEADEYEAYLEGDVYGFQVFKSYVVCPCCADPSLDEPLESCWGFYGDEPNDRKYRRDEAIAALEWCVQNYNEKEIPGWASVT